MIERIFYGRNGIDKFSLFLFAIGLVFLPYKYTWLFSILIICYALFRCFSKNTPKRQAELWKFQSVICSMGRYIVNHTVGLRKFFSMQALKWKNRKYTVYFKCPKCKKVLSLPRNRGKLSVTCTVCGHNFIKKT